MYVCMCARALVCQHIYVKMRMRVCKCARVCVCVYVPASMRVCVRGIRFDCNTKQEMSLNLSTVYLDYSQYAIYFNLENHL